MFSAKELRRRFESIGIVGSISKKVPFKMGLQDQYDYIFNNKVDEFTSYQLKFNDEENEYSMSLVTADDVVFDFSILVNSDLEKRVLYIACDLVSLFLYESNEDRLRIFETFSASEGDFVSNTIGLKNEMRHVSQAQDLLKVPADKKITKQEVYEIMDKYERSLNKDSRPKK